MVRAIIEGRASVLAEQLRDNPAAQECVTRPLVGGCTLLHIAARLDAVTCARVLLQHGADPNAACEQGETPLHQTGRTSPWRSFIATRTWTLSWLHHDMAAACNLHIHGHKAIWLIFPQEHTNTVLQHVADKPGYDWAA